MKNKKFKGILIVVLSIVIIASLLIGLGFQVYLINYNYRKYEFKLDSNSVDVQLGSVGKVPITLTSNEEIDYNDFTYTSTDTSIVNVDSQGNINPVNNGKAIIIVKAKKSNQSDMLNVNVVLFGNAIQIEDILLDNYDVKLEVGKTFKINASVIPNNSSFNSFRWSSSNTSVASVNDGVISGHVEGDCIIYVECGDIKKEIKVSVFK